MSASPSLDHLSKEAQRRTFGLLKQIVSSSGNTHPDTIYLHGGLPPPECFPISDITITLANGQTVSVPTELAQQQYNIAPTGLPSLQQWVSNYIQRMHHPQIVVDTIITNGSTSTLEMATALFLEPGDILLVEEFSYSHFLECIAIPKNYKLEAIPMDHQGIIPEAFEAVLQRLLGSSSASDSNDDSARQQEQKQTPKMLYTVPTGHNPTGACTPPERKAKILAICQKHNIIILEDEPYDMIQFPNTDNPAVVPGFHNLNLSSYLSMDTQGIVIHLGSFAKCIAPGFRLGWAVAPPLIAERLCMSCQAATVGANMLSQAIISEVLSAWGDDGLHQHLTNLQRVYASRAAALHAAAEEHLTNLADWHRPLAGMFMWVRLYDVEDTADFLPELQTAGVVLVPGRIASPHARDVDYKCSYVRISFSNTSEERLQEGIVRLSAVLRERRMMKKEQVRQQ